MEQQKPDTVKPKKEYEAPKIKDLIELSASGQWNFPPLQACTPEGGTGNTPCFPSGP